MDRYKKYIKDVESEISKLFDSIDFEKTAFEIIQYIIKKIKKIFGTVFKSSKENIKKINDLKRSVLTASNLEYNRILRQLDLRGLNKVLGGYFSDLRDSIDIEKYSGLSLQSAEKVFTNLMLLNLNAFVASKITEIIKQGIKGNATFESIRQQVQALDIPYLKTTVNDGIMIYERSFINEVSKDLGLEHFLYQGTEIATSRGFCIDKIGKAFTLKQVQSWVSKKWDGRNVNTTKKTIFIYVGGYNCHHRLLPISLNVYNELNNN